MSGHSKWSKVKHQKATTDVVKSAAFTKAARDLAVAAKIGGSRLQEAIEKARAVNMPKDNIERAIRGSSAGDREEVVYEAYGPSGVAMIITAKTDNKQRTVSMVKNILEHSGGTLTGPGGVRFLFDGNSPKPGMEIVLGVTERDKVMQVLSALRETGDVTEVITNMHT